MHGVLREDAGDASCRLRVVRLTPQKTNSKEGP